MGHEDMREGAVAIVRRLRDAGHEAYFAGGSVRDMVMGIEPHDYDIATGASPAEVAGLFDRVHPVGEAFGVSLVVLDGIPYHVARFRRDDRYEDGRRPLAVIPASAHEDVARRDFTINALLYDPLDDRLLDYAGGLDDIEARVVRTVGDPDERFMEDRLRMLRAVRFAARFGFTLDADSAASIRRYAAHVSSVSAERIGAELDGMLTGPHPDRALSLLDETGLLAVVLPEVAALKDVEQPPEFRPEGDVFTHTKLMLGHFGGGTSPLAWAVLLHDIGKPRTIRRAGRIRFHGHAEEGARMAEGILRRLRMSRDLTGRVVILVRDHMHLVDVPVMRPATRARLFGREDFGDLLALHRLDCLASHGSLELYDEVKKLYDAWKETQSDGILPPPLVTGRDLIEAGYGPGPAFSGMLGECMDAQLEGRFVTREAGLRFLASKYPLKSPRRNRGRKSSPRD